jgi:hypothetical protein
VDSVRDANEKLKSLMRRLEVLEDKRQEENKKAIALEAEFVRLRASGSRQESMYDEVQPDDNPLQAFYGIDAQPSSMRSNHGLCNNEVEQDESRSRRLTGSPGQRHVSRSNEPLIGHGDLRLPDEDSVQPEENKFGPLEAAPEIEYGWENTQQFKDMQKELAALRAMCRTQEPKSSGQQAEATQRPHQTIILPRENVVAFSDATTETEAEDNYADQNRVRLVGPRGLVETQR